jgi:hypothetical protein
MKVFFATILWISKKVKVGKLFRDVLMTIVLEINLFSGIQGLFIRMLQNGLDVLN